MGRGVADRRLSRPNVSSTGALFGLARRRYGQS
jgi:hypothetical protein